MSDTVIQVEGLSKQYRLGIVGRKTLHHDLNRWLYRIAGKEDPYIKIGEENDRSIKGNSEYVWALREISFEVKRGEAIGVIGRNGAGKSTLLKILSKVTSPTTGIIKMKGRIASLLEVGTGFHPELSGRSNIFLNGAILGMTKKEIQGKFDEIVDFSGVERYIDTPVKRYSSGMYVRLAFAVAAHLEPDILIVDEVLAVGDAEFQKKCLGKMKEVSEKEGRTVLFVSHNMDAISRLCTHCLYLANGFIRNNSRTDHVVAQYLQNENSVNAEFAYPASMQPGSDVVQLLSARVMGDGKITRINFNLDEKIGIEIIFRVTEATNDFVCGFNLYNYKDVHLFTSHDTCNTGRNLQPGVYRNIVWIPGHFLSHGLHYCGIAGMSYTPFKIHFNEINKISFNVVDVKEDDFIRDHYAGQLPGVVRPVLSWDELVPVGQA
jgi:lipopolysaccharide transport system ATP-binding protein